MKYAVVVITLLVALSASAAVDVDTLVAGEPVRVSFHYRVVPRRSGTSVGEIRWNVADSVNYRFARFSYSPASAREVWDDVVTLTWGGCDSGVFTERSESFAPGGDMCRDGFSLRLDYGDGGASVAAGVGQPAFSAVVDFDPQAPGRFMAVGRDGDTVVRRSLVCDVADVPVFCNFDSLDSLAEYLASSTDPYEGLWTYYDRDTDPRRAGIGGRYTVATVASGDGYDIVYIDGASDDSARWIPLRLKGRMTPATFPGVFDLRWLQPSGRDTGDDCSATLDGDLLTFQFPYWKATLRLRRVAVPR